ncbi:MAG: Uncharacterised protein [Alphaproteobacteria bacterium]|nr:MAG: Uncharacterised protein [Alphaproteobacteria bacterium]
MFKQSGARARRISDAKSLNHFPGHAAPLQISARLISGRGFQLRLKPLCRRLCHIDQTGLFLGPFSRARIALRHWQSCFRGEPLNRFGKAQAFGFHQEVKYRPMFAGGKAVIKLLVIIDGERGCAFLLERAEADKFAAASLQFHLARHHIRHGNTVFYFIKEARRKRHAPTLGPNNGSRHTG